MPAYTSLVRYTDQGARDTKESPKRLDAAKKTFNAVGGELKQWYLVMGRYDAVVISELPDDETARKLDLAIASLGSTRTEGFGGIHGGRVSKTDPLVALSSCVALARHTLQTSSALHEETAATRPALESTASAAPAGLHAQPFRVQPHSAAFDICDAGEVNARSMNVNARRPSNVLIRRANRSALVTPECS